MINFRGVAEKKKVSILKRKRNRPTIIFHAPTLHFRSVFCGCEKFRSEAPQCLQLDASWPASRFLQGSWHHKLRQVIRFFTPWKRWRWNLKKNYSIKKENHLPNHHFLLVSLMFHVKFPDVPLRTHGWNFRSLLWFRLKNGCASGTFIRYPPRSDVQLAKSGGQEGTREMWSFRGFICALHIITGWWISICIYLYHILYLKKKTKSPKNTIIKTCKNHKEKKPPYLHKKKKNKQKHTVSAPPKKETTFLTSSTSPPTPLQPYLGLIWRNIHQNHYLRSWVSCTKKMS